MTAHPEQIDAVTEFVESLFTTGFGSKAERLVLWRDSDKQNLGGWSRGAIADRLRDFLPAQSPTPSREAIEAAADFVNKKIDATTCKHPLSSREAISPVDRSERCGLCGMKFSDPIATRPLDTIDTGSRKTAEAIAVKKVAELYGKIVDEQLNIDVSMLDATVIGFDAGVSYTNAASRVPAGEEVREAVARLKQYYAEIDAGFTKAYDFRELGADVRTLLASLSPDDGWIPVSERLPGKSDEYEVTLENQSVTILYYAKGGYGFQRPESPESVVVAWRPKPQPYRKIEPPAPSVEVEG